MTQPLALTGFVQSVTGQSSPLSRNPQVLIASKGAKAGIILKKINVFP